VAGLTWTWPHSVSLKLLLDRARAFVYYVSPAHERSPSLGLANAASFRFANKSRDGLSTLAGR
jgi:hypothetical protein